MRPDVELTLLIEFDELFAFKERIGHIADRVRERLFEAGFAIPLQTEVFDEELEMRADGDLSLVIRLDNYHLEITGASPDMQSHVLAAIMLDESGVYRLGSLEIGLRAHAKVGKGNNLDLVARAFPAVEGIDSAPMLDRRISMTWEWATPTTGYSFFVGSLEDRELDLSFKAREGYMTLPPLHDGSWVTIQEERFEQVIARFLAQIGWEE